MLAPKSRWPKHRSRSLLSSTLHCSDGQLQITALEKAIQEAYDDQEEMLKEMDMQTRACAQAEREADEALPEPSCTSWFTSRCGCSSAIQHDEAPNSAQKSYNAQKSAQRYCSAPDFYETTAVLEVYHNGGYGGRNWRRRPSCERRS